MHNKTDRFGVPMKSQTIDLVGPTTYTVICKTQLENKVPFLSTGNLEPTFFNKTFCNTFYQLPETKSTTLGSSPRNNSSRSYNYETQSPGPAAYDVQFPKCTTQADRIKEGQRVKRLYTCRVPYTLVGSGPSVPSKLNANGYFVDYHGNVTPIAPTDYDTTLGPAFYDIKQVSRYEQKYRGIDWCRGKTKREFYDIDLNIPGPAHYDVKMPVCSSDEKGKEFREMARLMTFVPRYLDKQEMLTRSNNYPAPGDYDITKGDKCKRCPPLESTPFMSRSKRFKLDHGVKTPSATAYFHNPPKYSVAKLGIPFGIGSSRHSGITKSATPGPADYYLRDYITERLMKNLENANNKPPFGKSACRKFLDISEDILNTPSPQEYTLNNRKACDIYRTSAFKSKVPRFSKPCKTLVGSPARYNIVDSFDAVNNRRSHNVLHLSFNAKAPRKDFYDTSTVNNPCPASYETSTELNQKGFIVPKSPRWKDAKDNFPGPGSYLVHPSYRTSTFNAYHTHNLVLKEDVLKMSLRLSPKSTWANWAHTVKKNKKLRWFVNEGKGHIHCHKDLSLYKN